MPADLRFVSHAAQRHAHKLAVGGAGDGLAQRSLADTGRPDQAKDRTLELAHALLHRQVFDECAP